MATTLQKVIEKFKAIRHDDDVDFIKILSEHLDDEKEMILKTARIAHMEAYSNLAKSLIKSIEDFKKEIETK